MRTKLAVLTVLAVVGLAAIGSTPASAATQTAAAFAAACSAATATPAAALEVTGDLTVSGGTGTFTGLCLVKLLTPGARLLIINASLSGPDTFEVRGGAGSRLEISGSTITQAQRAVFIFGIFSTDHAAAIKVVNSTIVANGVNGLDLAASPTANDGNVLVNGSTLRGPDLVEVRASCLETPQQGKCGFGNTTGGKVTVNASKLEGGVIAISTGLKGKTTVTGNTFAASLPQNARPHSAPDGTCISSNNTPTTPCV